mmetsp:Transcript_35853/g.100876  ORF Transcript_35853/g.100876 Transcript_35853/m.100876 type:complete len:657 (+) Transcript_35853:180-2150(+)
MLGADAVAVAPASGGISAIEALIAGGDWKSQWPELQRSLSSAAAHTKAGRPMSTGGSGGQLVHFPKLTLGEPPGMSRPAFGAPQPFSTQPKIFGSVPSGAGAKSASPLLTGLPEFSTSMTKAPGPLGAGYPVGAIPKGGALDPAVARAIAAIAAAQAGGYAGTMPAAGLLQPGAIAAATQMPAAMVAASAPEVPAAGTLMSGTAGAAGNQLAGAAAAATGNMMGPGPAGAAAPLAGGAAGELLGLLNFPPAPAPADAAPGGGAPPQEGAAPTDEHPAKRPRVSVEEGEGRPGAGTAAEPKATGGGADEEHAWQEQWAEVFKLMHEGDMQTRAGEYAEAVVALKKNAEHLRHQHTVVQSSCEQLLHTAYREALQSHLKTMLEAAFVGVSKEVAEAARKTVEELSPPPEVVVRQPKAQMVGTPPLSKVSNFMTGLPHNSVAPTPHIANVANAQPSAAGLPGNAFVNTSLMGSRMVQSKSASPVQFGQQPPPLQQSQLLQQPPQQFQLQQPQQFPPQPQQLQQQVQAQLQLQPQLQSQLLPHQQPQFAQLTASSVSTSIGQDKTIHNNVWVGGLPDGIDDSMFQTLFARYGTIISIKLVAEQRYGFVKFAAASDAQTAIDALNGFECNGVKLQVRFADRDRGSPSALPGQGGGGAIRLS